MRRLRNGLPAAVAFAGLLVTGCSGSSASKPAPSDESVASAPADLDWGSCDDDNATDEKLRCATLSVPLDYDDSSAGSIDLALVKVPASGDREGAVLFNPGGPGASGFDSVASAGSTISSALGLDRFDLIGFDPRGVDRSGGLRCLSDGQLDKYAYPDDTPDTPEEQAFLDESEQAFTTACVDKYGDSLRLYSTADTARDMDWIRKALGDDQISYLGISYGTYLGAVYATMFPERVRAMVLDSAFEPGGDTIEQQFMTQLVGFEHAFDDWAGWCQGTESCAFRSDDVGAAWDALRQQLDDSPITNADGRVGNQALLERATVAALYSKLYWPVLGAALADATEGDPSGLFRLADSYFSRAADGTYATIQQSNVIISCASGIEADVPTDPEALAAEIREAAPRFGRDIVADDLADAEACDELMPKQPLASIGYDGEAPIVVIGGRNDPATPFRWAQEMTSAMGRSARLVTYTGEGHGQLLASSCVTEIEATALTDLNPPDEHAVCEPDPEVERPAWWDSLPAPDGVGPVTELPEIAAALGLTPTDLYSEIHTSDLQMADVLTAFRPALEAVDFRHLGEQEPIAGSTQAVYSAPNGDLLSILVLGRSAFDDPQLQTVAALVPQGETVVILFYLPQP